MIRFIPFCTGLLAPRLPATVTELLMGRLHSFNLWNGMTGIIAASP